MNNLITTIQKAIAERERDGYRSDVLLVTQEAYDQLKSEALKLSLYPNSLEMIFGLHVCVTINTGGRMFWGLCSMNLWNLSK